MNQIVKIPIKNFESIESAIDKINRHVKGKSMSNISVTRLSLMRSEIEISITEPVELKQAKGAGTSKYRGVFWVKSEQRWRAQFSYKGKRCTLGRFDNEIDAAKAYDQKAYEVMGAHAYLNFPWEVSR